MSKLKLVVMGGMAFGLGLGAMGALPQVTGVTLKQTGQKRVEVSYALSEEAIVTLRILTNGAPIAASALWNMSGDVNRRVAAGEGRRIVWAIGDVWPADVVTNVQAEVTAWRPDAPPLYCAADISSGPSSSSYPISYYASADDVPGGVTNDVWKLERMLFRRIDPTGADGVQLGSQKGMIGYGGVFEMGVRAWITRPFYLSVYETTQRQWLNVMDGTNPLFEQADINGRRGDLRPVERVSYNSVRGGTPDSTPEANSFVDRLRSRTAHATMDLPTEAQWEYACRAGGTEQFPYRMPITGTDTAQENNPRPYVMYDYFNHNSELNYTLPRIGNTGTSGIGKTTVVGDFPPNAFGLYDMVGNVWEWVLDRYIADRATLESSAWVDSTGPSAAQAQANMMVIKGGSYCEGLVKEQNKSSGYARHPFAANDNAFNVGFRMAIGLE